MKKGWRCMDHSIRTMCAVLSPSDRRNSQVYTDRFVLCRQISPSVI